MALHHSAVFMHVQGELFIYGVYLFVFGTESVHLEEKNK